MIPVEVGVIVIYCEFEANYMLMAMVDSIGKGAAWISPCL